MNVVICVASIWKMVSILKQYYNFHKSCTLCDDTHKQGGWLYKIMTGHPTVSTLHTLR